MQRHEEEFLGQVTKVTQLSNISEDVEAEIVVSGVDESFAVRMPKDAELRVGSWVHVTATFGWDIQMFKARRCIGRMVVGSFNVTDEGVLEVSTADGCRAKWDDLTIEQRKLLRGGYQSDTEELVAKRQQLMVPMRGAG